MCGIAIAFSLLTVKVLAEHHSKSASNSLNSLEAFLIMRHHLCVVFLFMRRQLIKTMQARSFGLALPCPGAALALRGIPCVFFLILCHFQIFASKFMQMLFLI